MFDRRIKIFIYLTAALLGVCILRLMQMQLLADSSLKDSIGDLKANWEKSQQFKTIRGRILDRRGRVLAKDDARFFVHLNYRFACMLDDRVRRAEVIKAGQSAVQKRQRMLERLDELELVIDKCGQLSGERADVAQRVKEVNNRVWNLRAFVAWVRSKPDPNFVAEYGGSVSAVPFGRAMADLENRFPDENLRLRKIIDVNDLPELNKSFDVAELPGDDALFAAQIEFMDVEGVEILPKATRVYPYGSVASHSIGWVGPATQQADIELFAHDKLLSYLSGEVCGREDGAEYVCETVLRGRRGEEVRDIDGNVVRRAETRFGRDVAMTLDVELQRRIEELLVDPASNMNADKPSAAVVMDVSSGEILALVSVPSYDLNRVRRRYGELVRDQRRPLVNRATNKLYPPGSVAKPFVLIAGMETGRITASEVISCPLKKAPHPWPSCWIFLQSNSCHDYAGPNNARNAIKGSCNIYFSHLGDRLNPRRLQRWLYRFGYGRRVLPSPTILSDENSRNLRQASGLISSSRPRGDVNDVNDLPPILKPQLKQFGIGQGNFRATPLQVATVMAAVARHGVYKPAKLFFGGKLDEGQYEPVELDVSPATMNAVYDGMRAVVNEPGGTAYKVFADAGFDEYGLKIYGKTGSTESPENAWFAGFVSDAAQKKLSIAVVVEGGQSGSHDAAPLAREIIRMCVEEAYIGTTVN